MGLAGRLKLTLFATITLFNDVSQGLLTGERPHS